MRPTGITRRAADWAADRIIDTITAPPKPAEPTSTPDVEARPKTQDPSQNTDPEDNKPEPSPRNDNTTRDLALREIYRKLVESLEYWLDPSGDSNSDECPTECPKEIPVYKVDGNRFPNHTAMVDRAINQKGKPNILTRGPGDKARDKNRRDATQALKAEFQKYHGFSAGSIGLDADEYPFASTEEGGKGAHVEFIPSQENRNAGREKGTLGPWLRSNVKRGCKFEVRPINVPSTIAPPFPF